jgi:CelD/BcsL family acetyltransferase involved in cellulose biosynthesis
MVATLRGYAWPALGTMPSRMQLRVHSSVASVAAGWEELAARTAAPPWMRPGWIEAWWQAFGRGALELLAVHRGDELVAVCPTERRRAVRAGTANWHSPTFAPLADGPEPLEVISRALLSGRVAMVSLRPLPAEDDAAAALTAAAASAGLRTIDRSHMRSPFVPLDGTFEAFCKRERPGRRLLKDIRRNRRRLEAEGEVTFEVHDGTERLDAVLEEAYAVEAAGWQGSAGTAIVSDARTRGFYDQVARWAAPRGLLRVMFLRVGGRAIAFEYCLLNGRELADLKGGYRAEYRTRSPGMLMALEIIRWSFAQGLAAYDFLGGDEPYKLRWTGDVRDRCVLHAFPRTLAGTAAWRVWRHGHPAVEGILARSRHARPRS